MTGFASQAVMALVITGTDLWWRKGMTFAIQFRDHHRFAIFFADVVQLPVFAG